NYAADPEYADDIRRIKSRARALLAAESDPKQALEAARRQALEHQGHGNVYAVINALAGIAAEARR
ncbi:MAG: hypothetical protein C4321_10565, partial [Chloroflexota bacterium]